MLTIFKILAYTIRITALIFGAATLFCIIFPLFNSSAGALFIFAMVLGLVTYMLFGISNALFTGVKRQEITDAMPPELHAKRIEKDSEELQELIAHSPFGNLLSELMRKNARKTIDKILREKDLS